jgi:serine/threonine-protein kinase HipA
MGDGMLAYLVARFDRPPEGGKRRMEDLCQLRQVPPGAKYDATAVDCAETIRRYSAEPAADQVTLFELFVFSHWIGNGDLHLKNISLLADADGRHLLSPVYDQVCTAAYPAFDPRPALPLLDGAVKHVRPGDWVKLAVACGVPPRLTARILARPDRFLARATDTVTSSHLQGDVRDAFTRVLRLRAADLLTESRRVGDG